MNCKDQGNTFYIDLDKIHLYEPWEISRDEFLHPSKIDKQRYDGLLDLGFDKWPPIILIKGGTDDGDDLLFDGYHRYAIAKYLLKKERILACY